VDATVALLLSVLAGWLSTGAVAILKRLTGVADTAVGAVLKKFQPLVALGLTALLPILWGLLSLPSPVPDVATVINAPIGTLVGIVLAELTAILKKKLTGDKTPAG
jgi:hypothetical protein